VCRAGRRGAGGPPPGGPAPSPLPLVEAVRREQAPPPGECPAEGGLRAHRLGPRVDQAAADRDILGPERHEPPPDNPEFADRASVRRCRGARFPYARLGLAGLRLAGLRLAGLRLAGLRLAGLRLAGPI